MVDLITILAISALCLFTLFIVLIAVLVIRPVGKRRVYEDEWEVERDIHKIKDQIEHEGKKEAEEELMVGKPASLKEPRKRRL